MESGKVGAGVDLPAFEASGGVGSGTPLPALEAAARVITLVKYVRRRIMMRVDCRRSDAAYKEELDRVILKIWMVAARVVLPHCEHLPLRRKKTSSSTTTAQQNKHFKRASLLLSSGQSRPNRLGHLPVSCCVSLAIFVEQAFS